MSETEGAYTYRAAAEPGITALQAGYERAVYEGDAWRALALALLTKPIRTTLRILATERITELSDFYARAGHAAARSLPRLDRVGLICYIDGAYRLTPRGEQVAQALAGEG